MKRILALTLAGMMVCSATAMAAPSASASDVAGNATTSESAGTDTASDTAVSASDAIIASIAQEAAQENKSVGEYTNNAVVSLPGVSEVVPMAQGGHVIINGAPSNVIFFLAKPSTATISQAKTQAQAVGGKILNVVTTRSSVVGKFKTAQVNFYAKGVKAGQNIKVYQLINGQWIALEVVEIREDHVVINMTQHGILAFIEVPEVVVGGTPVAGGTTTAATVVGVPAA